MKTVIKIIIFPLTLFLNPVLCLAQPELPIEVVRIFDKHYGGPLMDEIADYTTPRFRDNKPKAVWVAETSKSLNAIKYERLNSAIIDSRVKGNRAVIILKARINTMCGPLARNETYYLVRDRGKWLIDELMVTD